MKDVQNKTLEIVKSMSAALQEIKNENSSMAVRNKYNFDNKIQTLSKEKCQMKQRELETHSLEISAKSSEIEMLQKRNSELQQQVDLKTDEVTRLSEDKDLLQDLVNDHERTANEHDEATQCLRSELQSQKDRINNLNETLQKVFNQNQEFVEKQKAGRLELLEKQSIIDEFEKKSNNDEETITFLKEEIARLEKSKSDLKNQVDQMKKDSILESETSNKNLEELQKTNQRIQRQNSGLQNQIDKLEKTYDSQVESAESLQIELNQVKDLNLELTNQLKGQTTQIEELKSQKNNMANEIEELTTYNQGLVADLNQFKGLVSDLRRQVKNYQLKFNPISQTSPMQEQLQDSAKHPENSDSRNSAPNSPSDATSSSLPITSGTTGTVTGSIPDVSSNLDLESITVEENIPSNDILSEKTTNEIKTNCNSINASSDQAQENPIDPADVACDRNTESVSVGSDSELIEDALSIESDSDIISSNSNGVLDQEVKHKHDFNNSNSKVPEPNVDDGLSMIASEDVTEKNKSEAPKKVLRPRKSAPVIQEPTSSARSVRAKRSSRNEPFIVIFIKKIVRYVYRLNRK